MAKKALTALLLCVTIFNAIAMVWVLRRVGSMRTDTQYTLFISLNDKDSNQQEISDEEALAIVEDVLTQCLPGFTMQDATGMWIDETGTEVHEKTIVCYMNDTDDATVYAISDELLQKLHQSTILIQRSAVSIEYYSGK